MNLVCQEYVVCKSGAPLNTPQSCAKGGVLILSEFCGAAQSLSGAVMVNPWNTVELADTINLALTLPPQDRQVTWRFLYKFSIGAYGSSVGSSAWNSTPYNHPHCRALGKGICQRIPASS